jgi:serine/threonine protein kinase/Tfp pilus assembly protein PilF
MSDDRFARIKKIVLAASGLPLAERSAYLDEACGNDAELRREAESLLAHAEESPAILRTEGLGDLLGGEDGGRFLAGLERSHPERIGPYRILDVLGEGGMGVVYRAEQTEPIRREVALKLVRLGLDSDEVIRRFQAERQVLALMDHPGIARVLDAGADDLGRPYFVMDLVQGLPITTHCRQHRVPLRDRIRLVHQVCSAVQHAHQKGIIHRDLKPSNLLVASQDGAPAPRVIDFGIAKALEEAAPGGPDPTREGQPVGSVRYMSPEQARGETGRIDTRSDVFSLGVVLYEVLTERHPFPADSDSLFEQIRATCERPPAPFPAELPGGGKPDADLETITRKALAKEPEERYQSAAALGDDLERYLASQPIHAHPPSAAYQLRKLVARNRMPSALIGGITLLVIGFGIGMSILYARSETNLRRALTAEGEASLTSDFLEELFQVNDPAEAQGDTITAREILDRGAERIESELAERPEIQVRLLATVGQAYRRLGLFDRAAPILEDALEKQRSLHPGGDPEAIEALLLDDLGSVYSLTGRYSAARECFQRALGIRRERVGVRDTSVAATLTNLALVHREEARLTEAESCLVAASEIMQEMLPGTLGHAKALNNLAQVYQAQGRFQEAVALFDSALAIRKRVLEPNHPDLATGLNNLAVLLREQGRHAEAAHRLGQAIAIWEHVLGPDHPSFGVALVNQAAFLKDAGKYDEAEPVLRRALKILEGSLGSEHPSVATALNNLGRLLQAMERWDEAEASLRRSLEIQEAAFGPDHPGVATALNSLGELCLARDRLEAANAYFRRAIAIREATLGADHFWTALPVHNLGLLRLKEDRLAEAEPLLRRALEIRTAAVGPSHVRIAESLEALAELRRRQGRTAEADSLSEQAREVRARLE